MLTGGDMKKSRVFSISVTFIGMLCAAILATPPNTLAASFKDYPNNQFDAKAYVAGMEKIGHNTLAWVDPTATISSYPTATIVESDERLLPVQNTFSYTPFITLFNVQFKQALNATEGDTNSLRVETAVVECNPGNRAARVLIGMGAGKVACAAVCEVYEPGRSNPSMRIYTRDTGSIGGAFGGDSVSMMNHILTQLAIRTGAAVKDKMSQ